jgi:hypothetical protein
MVGLRRKVSDSFNQEAVRLVTARGDIGLRKPNGVRSRSCSAASTEPRTDQFRTVPIPST